MNDFFNEEYWKLVDWIRSNCREIPALHVHGEYPPQGRLQYILDNLKVTGSLKIFVKTIQRLPLRIPNTINELEIRFGFNDTSWTNREINLFYKSWIEMKSHQNLESFEINLTSREDFVAVALRGIPYQMGSPRHFRFNTLLDGSFEVTRKDGLTASVCVYQDRSEFIAVLCTSFFVPTRFFPFYANL
ncbi:hypothetical protein B9Z55_011328 [Caenorhabditis nigoni]|nr:hypothetical protein B9Z55_011328 [Caenorhabditis nigoni]